MGKKMFAIEDHNLLGFLYAAASSFLVGLGFIFSKMILKELNSESSSVYFVGFGLLASFLFLGAKRELKKLQSLKIYGKPLITLGFLGGISALAWFYAIDLIGPSLTSFLIRFVIVFTALWGVLFFQEKFNKTEVLGMLIAVAGVFLLTYVSNRGQLMILGTVIALISTLLFSLMQVIVKVYAAKITPFMVNHYRLMFTFPLILVYALVGQKLQVPSLPTLALALIGGILTGVIGVSLFFKAIELAELSKVNIIRTMDPFVVVFYAFLFFREVPTFNQLLGGTLIVVGILILTLTRYRPKFIARWMP